jgi:hypothetical protein
MEMGEKIKKMCANPYYSPLLGWNLRGGGRKSSIRSNLLL